MIRCARHGAAHILIAVMLAVTLILSSMTVDLAYIHTLRTEQKVATDAAAKAAVESLMRTGSVDAARAAAISIAERHRVGTASFGLNPDDIQFGNSSAEGDGSFSFQEGGTPLNSARITGRIGTDGSVVGAIPLLFPRVDGHGDYSGDVVSASACSLNEVCLCIDRSGSMKFDDSGTLWRYPPNNPLINNSTLFNDNYFGPPHPSDSRWAVLIRAINVFMNETGQVETPPRTALVTWSTNSSIDVPLPPSAGHNWTENQADINAALAGRALASGSGSDAVFGSTHLAHALQEAIDALDVPDSHPAANRSIIVFSDGDYQGPDPLGVAETAATMGITIHSITFIAGTAFDTMRNIAEATGGKAFMATSETQLSNAFEEIARSLNIILTE